MSELTITRASEKDVKALAHLFDGYRLFYRQASALDQAREFLAARLANNQSTIFIAYSADMPAGFVQLYPSFSSVSMAPVLILNDLFVGEHYRGLGIASSLLEAAVSHAREVGAVRVSLSTELNNTQARALYEKSGWQLDTNFCVYHCLTAASG